MSKCTPQKIVGVITYPYPNIKHSLLVNGGTGDHLQGVIGHNGAYQ